MSFTVQHIRSSEPRRRPNPEDLVDGQIAINNDETAPGMFFRTSESNLVKAGPPILSPNAPDPEALKNYQEYSVGEFWINTNNNALSYWSEGGNWTPVGTADLVLSNEGTQNEVDGTWGSYVIQEGEEDLFLINKRSGKKYKFMLQEVE